MLFSQETGLGYFRWVKQKIKKFHETSAPKLSVQQCLLTQSNDSKNNTADCYEQRALQLKGRLNKNQGRWHVPCSADSNTDKKQFNF